MEIRKQTPVENFVIFVALLLLYIQTSAQHYVRADRFDGASLYADVVHYVKLGIHRTGTEGDNRTSEWIKGILDKNGFKTEYVTFPVKQFFPEKTQLTVDGKTLEVFPVWPVANPNVQLTGTLTDAQNGTEGVKGKIVWISQASKERSFSFLDKDNATVIKKFIESGAKAIVLIADNAAGEIAAINTSPGDSWAVPVVQLAPKDLHRLKDGASASLNIRGKLREVIARNIQGTIGSGEKTVIISTPISGWFTCGGERGPGIATFNALAKWVGEKKLPYKFIFTGNSGHELAQHQGTHIFLHEKAPKPEDVRLWFHLGASFATFSYDKTAEGVTKRPEADGNRIVYYSGEFAKPLDEAFKNVKINKAPNKAYGELVVAQQKDYSRFIGLVGTASFALFHTPLDDATTTSPQLLEEMANAVKEAIELELARDRQEKEIRFLTNEKEANDYWPGFTADGKRIFFSRQKQGQPWQLFEIPFAGGEARPFWNGPVGATRASAAPNGQVAFTGIRQGQPASLWLTDDAARNAREVTIPNLTGNPFYPSWYPGNKQVAIVAYQGESGGNIVKVDLASGHSETLTDPAEIRCGMPFVSPDGRTIVFAGQRPAADNVYDQTRNAIWVRSEDGKVKQLSPGQGRAPVWSPDGRWVAYESTKGSATGQYAIYITSADGRINKRITAFEWDANHPVFSPDSQWLVVSAHHPDAPKRTGIAVIPANLAALGK